MMLAVDPGIQTGWALWDGKSLRPEWTGVAFPQKGMDWIRGMLHMTDKFVGQLKIRVDDRTISEAWFEWPRVMHSVRGQAAAGGDAYTKLCAVTGALMRELHSFSPETAIEQVPVNEWKGQLPKQVVTSRVRDVLGGKLQNQQGHVISTHAIDATGIGFWVRGEFE